MTWTIAMSSKELARKTAVCRLGAAAQERNPTTITNNKTRCPFHTICGVLGCAPKKEIADEGPLSLHPTYY